MSDTPVGVKPTDTSTQKSSNQGVPKAPVTNNSAINSGPVAHSTPEKGCIYFWGFKKIRLRV